jgi:hypothetical protein
VCYLPDFRVVYPDQGHPAVVWFEVKPSLALISAADIEKCGRFDDTETLIVLDGVPEPKMYLRGGELRAIDRESRFRDGLALWSGKQRPWWDSWVAFFGPQPLYPEAVSEIEHACLSARHIRFDRRAA